MALTTYGKNQALRLLGKGTAGIANNFYMQYVSLMEGTVYTPPSVSMPAGNGVLTSTGGKLIATGKLAAKQWVIIEAITGGTGSEGGKMLVVGRPYLVKAVTETTLELMEVEGGNAIKPEVEVTAITLCGLTEAGVVKGRLETAFGAAAEGEIADAAHTLEVEANKKVRYAAWWAHISETTPEKCMAISKLNAEESFGNAGKYELTSDKLEANPASVA